MNMLIIGNGFDLAHERPTTYVDFLGFAKSIMRIQTFTGNQVEFQASLSGLKKDVREYVLDLREETTVSQVNGQVRTNNRTLLEIWDRLDKNIWYDYFVAIWENDLIRGKNWIDFEREILEVIDFFDHGIKNVYSPISNDVETETDSNRDMDKLNQFWRLFRAKMRQEDGKKCLWFDFIDKTYQDLQDLVRCLEIYLDDCVGKMPIINHSPDIQELEIYSVLSFNYTTIPTDVYPSLTNTHYIHGQAVASRSAQKNNMVLGVNEYWDNSEKDFRTNFNSYKKFVQRIIKDTGIGYKSALKEMLTEHKNSDHLRAQTKDYIGSRYNNVYIFGHSLDITDGDILREVMRTQGIITTIFYRHKQQQATQIANLSKVLGQEELLKCVFSVSPTIIFKQQVDMEKL